MKKSKKMPITMVMMMLEQEVEEFVRLLHNANQLAIRAARKWLVLKDFDSRCA